MRDLDDYPFEIRPLSAEEGGGFLISFPDFSECLSDGETIEEAIANGRDALAATMAALEMKGLPGPAPNSGGVVADRLVTRVPETVRARLSRCARQDGVSLDALVLAFITEGLIRREHRV